jgi:hypothetical protein
MNKIDINEELLKREMLKKVRITQNAVIINCDICSPLLWNDNNIEALKRLGLPNQNFCGKVNEELARYVYMQLMKRKLEG